MGALFDQVGPVAAQVSRRGATGFIDAAVGDSRLGRLYAFRVMCTNPQSYSVRPLAGIVCPGRAESVNLTFRAMEELPADFEQRTDTFKILALRLSPAKASELDALTGDARKDAIRAMWSSDTERQDVESQIRVSFERGAPTQAACSSAARAQ